MVYSKLDPSADWEAYCKNNPTEEEKMADKWRDWSDMITAEVLKDNMTRRKITVACYYKNGERRTIVWHPFKRELVVSVNGVKTTYGDDQRERAITTFKRGIDDE